MPRSPIGRVLRLGLMVAWVWTGLVVGGGLVLGVLVGVRDGLSLDVVLLPLVAIVYAVLGLLVVVRRPGNRVAWLFFVLATWVALNGATVLVIGDETLPPDPPSELASLALIWDDSGYFVGFFVPVFLFFYLFPTGRFLTRRWAWAGCLGAALTSMATLDSLLQAEVGPDAEGWTITNPIGILETNSWVLQAASAVGLLLLLGGGVLAIITRYRRADLEVRSQVKWVNYGLGVMLASFFGTWLLPEGTPDWVDSLLFGVVLVAIPVSVMIAITRYRLYDIDRLVSRTVGYVIVVSGLALVYVVGAVWLPSRMIGEQSQIFVATSTLVAAALFNPIRKRTLELVDRRFNRSHYNAEQLLEEFGNRIGGRSSIAGLVEHTTSVVAEAMQPVSIGLWVRPDDTDLRI